MVDEAFIQFKITGKMTWYIAEHEGINKGLKLRRKGTDLSIAERKVIYKQFQEQSVLQRSSLLTTKA